MKNILFAALLIITCHLKSAAQYPDSVFTGKQGTMHVQSAAIDKAHGYLYFSFTDRLIKTDLNGKLIGSVTGFVGHLGDLDFNEKDGRIYGSLEYKDDVIGKGIKKQLKINDTGEGETGFYIAIFDGAKIVRPDMNAEQEDLIRTVYLPEVVKDYNATVHLGSQVKQHRFACSGIDGVAFAPAIGSGKNTKRYLYVAYGVYGDTDRNDNDNQIIMQYDIADWDKYAQKLSQEHLHHSGPEKPLQKYFVHTGSTNYGIQNLAYDDNSGNLFAAVYHGTKPENSNYDLFVINAQQKPKQATITSDNQQLSVKTLDVAGGWHFKWGSTGLCPLGSGLFYISHNEKTKDGHQQGTLHKYRWVGDAQTAFVPAK